MLETSQERVALLKAGRDGKTIEKLYIENNNLKIVGCTCQKINCWDFVGCGKELGGERVAESGMCRASLDISADGINHGMNGGRICWAISGTFSGKKIEGFYAKKLLSCRSCKFFKGVRDEEGSKFSFSINKINAQATETACDG